MVQVTISGADDKVNPDDLVALSAEFPFVEWGILFSKTRAATARYPSQRWIDDLATRGLRLSAHLCGQYARDIGKGELTASIPNGFARIQINMYDPAWYQAVRLLCTWPDHPSMPTGPLWKYRVILPARSVGDFHLVGSQSAAIPNCSLLFDPSGGRGQAPTEWPTDPAFSHGVGYAGGITPETFGAVLDAVLGGLGVTKMPDHIWFDMESGVRDQHDTMDLRLVREILTLAHYADVVATSYSEKVFSATRKG